MPEFLDCIVEDINRIKVLIDLDRPSLRFVYFDECEEHVELVTLLGALRSAPAGIDLGERGPVVFVSTDWPDFHRMCPSVLRYGQSVDAIVLGMRPDELHEGPLSAEIESDQQAVVSSCNFKPDALAIQHLGFRSCSLDLIRRRPMRRSDKFVPTFERDLRLRVLTPKVDQCVSGNDPHRTSYHVPNLG